jgi:hypothetical protein
MSTTQSQESGLQRLRYETIPEQSSPGSKIANPATLYVHIPHFPDLHGQQLKLFQRTLLLRIYNIDSITVQCWRSGYCSPECCRGYGHILWRPCTIHGRYVGVP